MGLQLIFVVESDSTSKTDWIYIKSTIEYFFKIGNSDYKLTPIYMGGRGNYDSKKISRSIEEKVKSYKAGGTNNTSKVIYCFDCDKYDTEPEDCEFLYKAKSYCEKNGYEFVWFCRNVEHVFLGKHVINRDKTKESSKFKSGKKYMDLNSETFSGKVYTDKRSNLFLVLENNLEYSKGNLHSKT